VLLLDGQIVENDIKRSTLQQAADKAAAALRNGAVVKSDVNELLAEVAGADLAAIEFKANRNAYFRMLCLMIGKDADSTISLTGPVLQTTDTTVHRPELLLFDLQRKTYDAQEQLLRSDYLPRLNAFVQGAYGRPTLNIIENRFGPWWIGGLRLTWNLGSLYTLKNNRSILQLNRSLVDVDRETFLFNTRLSMTQQNSEIGKYTAMLKADDTIIGLRNAVSRSAQAQLDNGVITAHDYISILNAENIARQTRILHHTQLLQAQYNYKNISGN